MKIIFCRWNSICEEGVTHAFERLGIPVVYLDRKFTHVDYDNSYVEALSKMLTDNVDANMVFSINYIPVIARVCNLFNVLYLSWIVDSPCFQLYSETLKYPTNRVFCFDYSQYERFNSINKNGVLYLTLGTDVDVWDKVKITEEDHKRYDCDISFIGSLYSEKCVYNDVYDKLPKYIQGYSDGVINAQMKVHGYNFIRDSITEEFARDFKEYANWPPLGEDYDEDIKDIVADTYIGHKCTEQDRIATLNAIGSRFNIDLYTLSDTSLLRGVNCCGGADSTTMMPKIIKCSKINLNFTNKPIKTGLPLRIFDIMGMGGFLISNYQSEIPEYFVPGEDIVLYESISNLLELIDYFLKNEDERLRIANNGYMKVKSEHTYDNKIMKMFEMILEKK